MSVKRLLITLSILLIAALVIVPAVAQDSTTIKVYTSWPLTGGTQAVGESMLKASQLAVAHYMEDHDGKGPAGFTVEIVPLDDASPTTGAWDGTIEAENAQRCVNDAACMIYFGTYNSGAAKVSMVITNQAGMAQISPANSYAGLTRDCGVENGCQADEPGIYRPTGIVNYFRTNGTDDVQGPAGASWAVCAGFKKVYILDDTQAYGKGVADTFANQATKVGLEVAGRGSVESTDIDFRALLNDVRASGADLVYGGFVLDSGGPQVIQQMESQGLFDAGVKFMGPDGLASDSLVEQAGGADVVNGNVMVTFPGPLPSTVTSDIGKRFYTDYLAKYDNEEPDPYALYAYQATQVILNSIEVAGKADRTAILDAMRDTKDFEGILATFSFDENGDSTAAGFYGYDFADGTLSNPVLITPTMQDTDCKVGS
ncbi:MAG: branched-chain amino acid ABC transporter substrate-binding protein [Chloroflexota bacterium]